MKQLRMTMKLSNNRIRQLRLERKLTIGASATAIGVHASQWSHYENLHAKPFSARHNTWTPTAVKIAKLFGVTCEWLWPDEVLAVTQPTLVAEVDAADLRPALVASQILPALPAPDEILDAEEERETLYDRMDELPLRHYQVVRMLFGFDGPPLTLTEVGEKLGVSIHRVQQIRDLSLSKLRRQYEDSDRKEESWYKFLRAFKPTSRA